MHTFKTPQQSNYQYHPARYSNQGEVPMHENDLVETTRVVPHRTADFYTRQEYDCPESLDLVGDDLINTLIIRPEFNVTSDGSPVQDTHLNIPHQIVDLISSLETLSKSLSTSEKQFMSHQLTKLSYTLQTECLYPDSSQQWETPAKRSPSPPTLTPRKPNHQVSDVNIVAQRVLTPSDWSGPGSFPTCQDQNRPTKLNINTLPASCFSQRSASVQYDQKCLVKQKSDEVIYANTSSTPTSSGPHTNKATIAPPLPPRDRDHTATGPDYQNLPPSRGSKKKNY